MQDTSDLYKELLQGYHWKETRLAIGNADPETAYDGSTLISLRTYGQVFSAKTPTIGSCVARNIVVELKQPEDHIPRQAKLVPFVRLTDGTRSSEWIQKGVFYIDTRFENKDVPTFNVLRIEGYDDMLKTEQDYPESTLNWPAKDIDVVMEIATFIGVPLDPRTITRINRGFQIEYPGGYSCREVLGNIASMYHGCFIMSDVGRLLLVAFEDVPTYLITEDNNAITFGGVRILV